MSFQDPDDYARKSFKDIAKEVAPFANEVERIKREQENQYTKMAEERQPKTEDERRQLYNFLSSREKPFYIDEVNSILRKYDKEEISLSKFVEELNIIAWNWRKNDPTKTP